MDREDVDLPKIVADLTNAIRFGHFAMDQRLVEVPDTHQSIAHGVDGGRDPFGLRDRAFAGKSVFHRGIRAPKLFSMGKKVVLDLLDQGQALDRAGCAAQACGSSVSKAVCASIGGSFLMRRYAQRGIDQCRVGIIPRCANQIADRANRCAGLSSNAHCPNFRAWFDSHPALFRSKPGMHGRKKRFRGSRAGKRFLAG